MDTDNLPPLIDEWLNHWQQWLNECLSTGVNHIGSATKSRIHSWIYDAETLGFENYAQIAKRLLEVEDGKYKATLLQQCLLGFQALNHLVDMRHISSLNEE